ncbi:MAG: hypothetical protein U1D30_09420 [Planctomycetota bacterium]
MGIALGMIAVLAGAVIKITSAVATQWRYVRQTEIDASLKAQLVDKGFSAAEIEQVMNSGVHSARSAAVSPREFSRNG